jgi:hypothetical protein
MALLPFKRIRPYVSPEDQAAMYARILVAVMHMSPEEQAEYLEEPEPLPPPIVLPKYYAFAYGVRALSPLDPSDTKEWGEYHICPECYGVELGMPEELYREIDYHYDELVAKMGTSRSQVIGHGNVRSGHFGNCTRWRRYWPKSK